MPSIRLFFRSLFACAVIAPLGMAGANAQTVISTEMLMQKIGAAPGSKSKLNVRVTRQELKRRLELREAAPVLETPGINFETGSARIPQSENGKIQQIAATMNQLLGSNPLEVFLIEGHTDAAGSKIDNQALSEQRAAALKEALVNMFGAPAGSIDTIGYGEDFPLAAGKKSNPKNRRVTIRRVTDIVTPF